MVFFSSQKQAVRTEFLTDPVSATFFFGNLHINVSLSVKNSKELEGSQPWKNSRRSNESKNIKHKPKEGKK